MDWLDIKEFLKDTIKYIIFIIVILFIAVYIVGLQQVVGPSMSPNFKNGDILILDKVVYRFFDIKRGDVVCLNYSDSKYLIKRVIGLPGEHIEYNNNELYINGEKIDEKYIDSSVITDDFSLKELNYDKIPDNMYLVLGDNRQNSQDSRDPKVGLISKNDIIGKARFRIWPINKIKLIK